MNEDTQSAFLLGFILSFSLISLFFSEEKRNLHRELRLAVAREDYELAANLRDLINSKKV